MDPTALFGVNGFVGNPPGAAVVEWALGPLVVRCDQDTLLSAMPIAEVLVGDSPVTTPWQISAPAGERITLRPSPSARFAYLGVRGGLDVPVLFESRSTYLPSGFGGLEGRRLRSGDRIPLGTLPAGEFPGKARAIAAMLREDPASGRDDLVVRVTPGPQWNCFDAASRERFLSARFVVDRASDRGGYRLTGSMVHPSGPATLPSEAACPGAIQIPDSGEPIVLMADGPTVGGYPKIGVVSGWDLARLAQRQPGAGVRFWAIPLDTARAGLVRDAEIFGTWSRPT